MFGKVLKYDFRADGRVLLPIFGLALASTAVMRLFAWLLRAVWERAGEVAFGIFQGLVILMMVAVVLFSFGYVVVRFYRNMVGREAYLTLTLPVKNVHHIWGKLLSGFTYCLASLLVAYAMLYLYDPASFIMENGMTGVSNPSIGPDKLLTMLNFTFWQKVSAIGWILVLAAVLCAYLLNEFFFCCAVGSQFKTKPLAAVITYFIVHNALGILLIVGVIFPAGLIANANSDKISQLFYQFVQTYQADYHAGINTLLGYLWLFLLAIVGLTGIVFTGEFLVSRYLLTKKVNLE